MKIKELDQHCGECSLIGYCGPVFGYAICKDERIQELDEQEYKKLAEQAEIEEFEKCKNCTEECADCDYAEGEMSRYCKQIADFVIKCKGD